MIDQLGLSDTPVQVIRAGGLHTASCKTFDQAFEKGLKAAHPDANTQVLDISPVYGAVVYAAHGYFGQAPTEFLTNLFTQARIKGEL